MSPIELSEKEAIQQELKTLSLCGDILEIESDEDNVTIWIITQPLKEYYELLRKLRVIERKEEATQDIFII